MVPATLLILFIVVLIILFIILRGRKADTSTKKWLRAVSVHSFLGRRGEEECRLNIFFILLKRVVLGNFSVPNNVLSTGRKRKKDADIEYLQKRMYIEKELKERELKLEERRLALEERWLALEEDRQALERERTT